MNFLANEPLRIALPLPHLTLLCKAWYGWCMTRTLSEFGPRASLALEARLILCWKLCHCGTGYCLFVTPYVFVFLLYPGGPLYNKITMDRAISHFMVLLGLQLQISQLYPILNSFLHAHQWKKVCVDQKFLSFLGLDSN